ncbi:MAG: sugar ABC transporter substrate-binding protein [Kiritimatiellae bacterium]|nr:sugar ABC transporter substrate-binding protein [Kiritimatiellia bacterium]
MAVISTLVLILCLVGILACYFRFRTHPQNAGVAIAVLIVVAIAAGGLRMCARSTSRPEAVRGGYYTAVAFKLGRAVAQSVPGGGEVLVVQYNFAGKPTPTSLAQIAGLEQAFKNTPLRVGAVEPRYDPAKDKYPQELTLVPAERGTPASLFFAALDKHPNAAAVVSFVGMPIRAEDGRPAPARERTPPVFLVNPGTETPWADWMKKGLVKAVVMPRPGKTYGPLTAASGKSGEALFDDYCQLITRENLDTVLAKPEPETEE